jgi:hypothetical protein
VSAEVGLVNSASDGQGSEADGVAPSARTRLRVVRRHPLHDPPRPSSQRVSRQHVRDLVSDRCVRGVPAGAGRTVAEVGFGAAVAPGVNHG